MIGVKGLAACFMILLSAFSFQLSAYCAEADMSAVEKSFLEGRYDEAIDESGALIDARSRNRDELYYIKGLSELKTDRYRQARKDFEYILSRYQRSARTFDAYTGIGDSYLLEGDVNQALKIYERISVELPGDKNIGLVYYRIGTCLNKLGAPDKAKIYFDKAERASPLAFEKRAPHDAEGPQKETAAGYERAPLRPAGEAQRLESGQYISVQAGSFRSRKNAERFTKKLSRAGYDSYIEMPSGTGEKLYRIKVGRPGSIKEANLLVSRLKEDGYRARACSSVSSE